MDVSLPVDIYLVATVYGTEIERPHAVGMGSEGDLDGHRRTDPGHGPGGSCSLPPRLLARV